MLLRESAKHSVWKPTLNHHSSHTRFRQPTKTRRNKVCLSPSIHTSSGPQCKVVTSPERHMHWPTLFRSISAKREETNDRKLQAIVRKCDALFLIKLLACKGRVIPPDRTLDIHVGKTFSTFASTISSTMTFKFCHQNSLACPVCNTSISSERCPCQCSSRMQIRAQNCKNPSLIHRICYSTQRNAQDQSDAHLGLV